MQIEADQASTDKAEDPFQIVRHARSSKASQSRKSSNHTMDRERNREKTKKLRKMTLNPEVFHFQQSLTEIKEQNELKVARSEKNDMEEEDFPMSDFLELGGVSKTHSKQEKELENGIFFGIASQRELDSDFNLGMWQHNEVMDLERRD